MGRIVTTSIRIDEDVWKKAKIKAIEEDLTVTEFLNRVLTENI